MFVKNMLKINLQVGPKQCLCLASCAINTLADIRVRTWVQLWQWQLIHSILWFVSTKVKKKAEKKIKNACSEYYDQDFNLEGI